MKSPSDILSPYENADRGDFGRDVPNGTVSMSNGLKAMKEYGKLVEDHYKEELNKRQIEIDFKAFWLKGCFDFIISGKTKGYGNTETILNDNHDKNKLVQIYSQIINANNVKDLEKAVGLMNKYITINEKK